mmetsp:Transcript_2899/g.11749  ORF Transcript_2899/g.11749 Transcript_2899/m.11749 type:complete len:435 (-) Transcript_2899:72-1376(-)
MLAIRRVGCEHPGLARRQASSRGQRRVFAFRHGRHRLHNRVSTPAKGIASSPEGVGVQSQRCQNASRAVLLECVVRASHSCLLVHRRTDLGPPRVRRAGVERGPGRSGGRARRPASQQLLERCGLRCRPREPHQQPPPQASVPGSVLEPFPPLRDSARIGAVLRGILGRLCRERTAACCAAAASFGGRNRSICDVSGERLERDVHRLDQDLIRRAPPPHVRARRPGCGLCLRSLAPHARKLWRPAPPQRARVLRDLLGAQHQSPDRRVAVGVAVLCRERGERVPARDELGKEGIFALLGVNGVQGATGKAVVGVLSFRVVLLCLRAAVVGHDIIDGLDAQGSFRKAAARLAVCGGRAIRCRGQAAAFHKQEPGVDGAETERPSQPVAQGRQGREGGRQAARSERQAPGHPARRSRRVLWGHAREPQLFHAASQH